MGWWTESPWGEFADAMVERADGHRMLLAPTDAVADLVSTTYSFDEVRIEPFTPPPDFPGPLATNAAARGSWITLD